MIKLKNLKIYTKNDILDPGYIVFDDHIISLGVGDMVDAKDMHGLIMIPGFIDQHVHGLLNLDIMDANIDAIREISKNLPKEGTTGYLATTMTASTESIMSALTHINSYMKYNIHYGAELIGVHLEGPFISKAYRGAQLESEIKSVDLSLFDQFNQASGHTIKQVTLAPELPGAIDFIRHLNKQHIVCSIGHTDANANQIMVALSEGASCFTHGYNRMKPFHHREIGTVGMMLLDPYAYVEVICDLIHVSPLAIKLLFKNKSSKRIILITDAIRTKGMPNGTYQILGQDVYHHFDQTLYPNQTLTGGVSTMIDALKHMKSITSCTIEDLILMSSTNAATLHHIDDRKGSIDIDKDADLVILDDELNIIETYCKGRKFHP